MPADSDVVAVGEDAEVCDAPEEVGAARHVVNGKGVDADGAFADWKRYATGAKRRPKVEWIRRMPVHMSSLRCLLQCPT